MPKNMNKDFVWVAFATALALVLVLFVVPMAKPAPKYCLLHEVAQESRLMRIPTCRQKQMSVAFEMCERDPVVVPNIGREVDIAEAPGIGVEECLAEWLNAVDLCPDEADRQWKLVCR